MQIRIQNKALSDKAQYKVHHKTIVGAVLVAFTLGGCANMTETQKTTAEGAGIGAAGVGWV